MAKSEYCETCPVGGQLCADQTCSVADPLDGLPLACVGEWAEDKHARVRKYVDISRATRRKFTGGAGGASYIDPYCGPARARIRGTHRIVDGSAVVAARQAIDNGVPFTEIHIADTNDMFMDAAEKRLVALGMKVIRYTGTAEESTPQILAAINPSGLHFALLDPYDLRSLPFQVIQQLAGIERMDLLIHVSWQDLQRNLRRYIGAESSPLDVFVPGWRDVVDKMRADDVVRAKILQYWLALIRNCKMQTAEGIEEVTGSKNQHLYWLVFVARHSLAIKFWEDIRSVTNQKSLGL
jgi:three-Cys-motif partner protein